jgi:hypothetical protein
MKRKPITYKFKPGSIYQYVQTIQRGPHAQKDENWSGTPPYPYENWEQLFTNSEAMIEYESETQTT